MRSARGLDRCPPHRALHRVGLGTMLFGTTLSEDEARRLLDRAHLHHGVSFFDTAEMYPVPQSSATQGDSERILGAWVRDRIRRGALRREDVTVATKVSGPCSEMPWIRGGPHRLDRAGIVASCEASLLRLGLDHVDLLQLHWPDRYVPMFGDELYDSARRFHSKPGETSADSLLEQLSALRDLEDRGLVRESGLSNETAWGLTRCAGLARESPGVARVARVQQCYSLLCRGLDQNGGLRECCHEEGVSVIAYSPLAMGLLTGKYLPPEGRGAEAGYDRWGPPRARLNLHRGRYSEAESRYPRDERTTRAVQASRELAHKRGMSLTELSIRFVLSSEVVGTALLGCVDEAQLDELCLYAGRGGLDRDALEEIDRVHAVHPSPTP